MFERLRMWLRCQCCVCIEKSLARYEFAPRHSESAWARRIPAEGSSGTFQLRTASQRGRFDTRNLRRGFVGHVTNSHGATARALGHAGSLQRVRRALFKFARRHCEGALTRAILAEGWLGTLRTRTAPQRERFEAREPCRGFIGHCTHARNVVNDRGLTKSSPHSKY